MTRLKYEVAAIQEAEDCLNQPTDKIIIDRKLLKMILEMAKEEPAKKNYATVRSPEVVPGAPVVWPTEDFKPGPRPWPNDDYKGPPEVWPSTYPSDKVID